MDSAQETPSPRSIAALIGALQPLKVIGSSCLTVQGIQHDSRVVQPGEVFVAISGLHTDGARHIDQALARGAVAVISDQPLSLSVPCLQVDQPRLALVQAAAWFNNYPSRKLKLAGVTGTNGKTTTCYLIKAILDRARAIAAVLWMAPPVMSS
ncbi:Mur ligase domain-containing protein [Geopsychrobacter electrodiphilus]|uniref:Mur ligase domain-containing protein n=1 Tax=Geopsychrobacter electrodiphilus TaxID=225196 RepID=UPI00036B3786|nr:Mur ligase domain-containing protein [Geopsychrobacter electrodiphilus]